MLALTEPPPELRDCHRATEVKSTLQTTRARRLARFVGRALNSQLKLYIGIEPTVKALDSVRFGHSRVRSHTVHHRSIRCDRVNRSGVTNEDRGRQLSSGAAADGSSGGGAKNSLTKICATNEHKSEYDKVCRMHQKQSIATKLCYFGCQLVQAFVIPLGSRVVIACWTQAH